MSVFSLPHFPAPPPSQFQPRLVPSTPSQLAPALPDPARSCPNLGIRGCLTCSSRLLPAAGAEGLVFSSGQAPRPSPGTAGRWQLQLAAPPRSGSVRLSSPRGIGALDPGRGFLGEEHRVGGSWRSGSRVNRVWGLSGLLSSQSGPWGHPALIPDGGLGAPIHTVERLGTSPQPWTRMAGQESPAQVHWTGVGGSERPVHGAPDRRAESVRARNPGPGQTGQVRTPARSRRGQSTTGKSS